jgi:hypothetical protein
MHVAAVEPAAIVLAAERLPGAEVQAACAWDAESAVPGRALAVLLADGISAYYAMLDGQPVHLLAEYDGAPDIQCHSAASAASLAEVIATSEGVLGQLRPAGDGPVACGFIAHLEAACWQFQSTADGFVSIGGWVP